jgi:hypothetical protein
MPVENNPNPVTDTGTGSYDNPPAEVTVESPADNTSTGAVEGPPAEVTVESPVAQEPTGASPNPAPETSYAQWPADTKAVQAGDPGVENKSLDSMTKAELQAEADRRGVQIPSGATKAEMIEALGG